MGRSRKNLVGLQLHITNDMYWKDDVDVIAESEKDITNMFEEMNDMLKEHLKFTYLFNHKRWEKSYRYSM